MWDRMVDVQVTTRVIAYAFGDTTPLAPSGKRRSTRCSLEQADDYDSWRENGTVCGRQISEYIAEVKGNGAYGDATGVIGALDFIVGRNQWTLSEVARFTYLGLWSHHYPLTSFSMTAASIAWPGWLCEPFKCFSHT